MKILTANGFKNFDGFICTGIKQTIDIDIYNNKLICTPDHKIKIQNTWIEAQSLPNKANIEQLVYDAINVADGNEYLTNNIISHNCLYLDELGHIDNDLEFYESTYPVISSGKKTKVIISSTPKGMNLFYKLWSDAIDGRNGFKPLKYLWNAHPHRGEEWKQETMKNVSRRSWDQEFECVSGDTIINIDGKILPIKTLYQNLNNINTND